MIYLDYQASAPLAPEAREAMLRWLSSESSANPHSAHAPGRAARAAVELARDQIATLLPPGGQVIFTSGATEAINLAIKGCNGPVAAFATEHAAVLDCVAHLGGSVLPVDGAGIAAGAIPAGTGLACAMLVNNEIGTVQDIAALADAAHRQGALLLCDAVQGFGRLPIPHGPDMIALSAHKIHGPKGIGALWVRDGVSLAPLMHGGGQEGGIRSGTLSPALCAGFGAAAALAAQSMEADAAHVAALWDRLRAALPGWQLNGSADRRWKGNLNIRRDGLDVARLMSDCRALAFSAGSACASGSGRPSHVLRAIGLSDAEAKSSIRLGFGRYSTEAEIDGAAALIRAGLAAQGVE